MAEQDPFVRNRRFTFGFLNTAQDGADLPQQDAQICQGLDADKLALGTLQSSSYVGQGTGAPDMTTASIASTDFFIDTGDIFIDTGALGKSLDSYIDTPPAAPSIIIEESNGGVEFSDTGTWVTFVESDITVDGEKGSANPNVVAGQKVMINPSNYTQTNKSFTYFIRIKTGGTEFERWVQGVDSGYTGTYPISGTAGSNAGYSNVLYDIRICMNSALSYSDGDVFKFSVAQDLLEDGDYFYSVSQITQFVTGEEVETIYSDPETVRIRNENYLGQLVSYGRPVITIARDADDDKWLYRKGPNDDEWVRIAIIASGTGSVTFADNILVSSLIDIKTVTTLNPETLQGLLDVSGATSWAYIFEKDNRLWAVPSDRKDIIFFSEPLVWWRWARTNSISFDGDFVGFTELRDSGTVELKNTAVFQTTSGLYNVYGDGTEDSPYLRVAHEKSFDSALNASVKVNNKIYIITDGASYDDGEWGRKLYEYDMVNLVELSAKLRGSAPFLSDTVTVSYMNHIGGDKILIVLDNGTTLVYHIKLEGFIETTSALETAGDWSWKSGIFHPIYSYATKLANVDKYGMVWQGDIDITFTIDGVDTVVSHSNPTRKFGEFLTPPNWGKEMTFQIDGTSNAILYDFYWIADK